MTIYSCGVPGCRNDILCSTQCYELVEGIPVCTDCVNALDADWRLLAVRDRVRRARRTRGERERVA
jgi:hypothetical protein